MSARRVGGGGATIHITRCRTQGGSHRSPGTEEGLGRIALEETPSGGGSATLRSCGRQSSRRPGPGSTFAPSPSCHLFSPALNPGYFLVNTSLTSIPSSDPPPPPRAENDGRPLAGRPDSNPPLRWAGRTGARAGPIRCPARLPANAYRGNRAEIRDRSLLPTGLGQCDRTPGWSPVARLNQRWSFAPARSEIEKRWSRGIPGGVERQLATRRPRITRRPSAC